MKNNKTKIAIIAVIALVLVTIGITYAYWLITRTQTKINVIGAGCLDISLTDEQNDISLQNQFPLSDEDGMKLTPYTFTVTNNCNTSVDYQLNLELLGNEETSIASTSIKIGLNDSAFILGNKETRETTESNAYTSYQLMYGRLEAKGTDGSSDTHNLRLWLDKEAPIEEMNKTLESKIVVRAGQGIENPYTEGTIAFNIVGNAGGSKNVSAFPRENVEVVDWPFVGSATDTYYWGTECTLDKTNGNYTLGGTITQSTINDCKNNNKCGKYTLGFMWSQYTTNYCYEVKEFESDTKVIASKMTYTSVEKATIDGEYGFYSAEDDYGTSYYFRGDVENNYVKFGKWSETDTSGNAGKDMYWRIVRINGDGTIRMIYDATIGQTAYNGTINNAKYVGYTYENDEGTQTDSTIKKYIDAWYDTNLETNYGTYIADSIFCNDRTSRVENGYTYYGAYDRLDINKSPQLTCEQKEDRYTMSTEYGNGYLTNPVGLITADEVALAGGLYDNSNNSFYLFNSINNGYWTLTPYTYDSSYAWVLAVNSSGSISKTTANGYYQARPVINLKADVKFTGEGTMDSPYEIVMN